MRSPIASPGGPYVDTFTEQQNKYGPFGLIEEAKKREIYKIAYENL